MRYPFNLFIIFFLILLLSCENDNASSVVNRGSPGNSVTFEELSLLMRVQLPDSSYVLLPQIDSVRIFINGRFWTITSSEKIDTSLVPKQDTNQFSITHKPIEYLLTAQREEPELDFYTAGAYADYLNAVNTLAPGEYLCMVESFQLTLADGSQRIFYPLQYRVFHIAPQERTAFAGTFKFVIDL